MNAPTTPAYTLPIASATTLGGVKIGNGINVGSDGTISVSASGNDHTTYPSFADFIDALRNTVDIGGEFYLHCSGGVGAGIKPGSLYVGGIKVKNNYLICYGLYTDGDGNDCPAYYGSANPSSITIRVLKNNSPIIITFEPSNISLYGIESYTK